MNRTCRLWGLQILCCILSQPVEAREIRFLLKSHDATLHGSATLHVWRIDGGPDVDPSDSISRDVDLERSVVTVDLPDGSWAFELEHPQLWHARQVIVAPGSGEVTVDLWPKSEVTAKVSTSDPRPPAEVTVTLMPSESGAADGPSVEVSCPIVNGAFLCSVPAGALDFRVRSKEYVAHHFFGRTTQAGKALDLGELRFQRGQSIIGRVERSRARGNLRGATVRAQPSQTADPGLLSRSAPVASNGLFHIDGVPPGSYVISAMQEGGLVSEPVEVLVRSGDEVELLRPIGLIEPRKVHLLISPPMNPDGDRWTVSLDRDVTESFVETVTAGAASVDGSWSASSLAPGRYSLQVTSDRGAWYRQVVDISAGDARLAAVISTRRVHGKVTLGRDVPLRAKVSFSDESALVSSTMSAEDGSFSLQLPVRLTGSEEATRWDARVESDEPSVHRYFRDVRISADAADERVDLEVTRSVLLGMVVTEDGEPIAGGWVNVIGDDVEGKLTQVPVSDSGEFVSYGLEPGSYSLQAVHADGESSFVAVTLRKDEVLDPIRLVAKPTRQVRGLVRSETAAVAGAQVTLMPVVPGGVPMTIHHQRTDAGGRYTHTLSPGLTTFDLAVAAPGFAFMLDRVEFHGKPLMSTLDQRPGTIVLRGKGASRMHLRHNGAVIPVSFLLVPRWTGRESGSDELSIPAMEPGPWSLCSARRCTDGYLTPFGALTLDISDSR